MVSSRTDLVAEGDDHNLVTVHSTLAKPANLQDTLQHLLDEPSFLAFRATVLEDIVQKSLSLLLNAQGISMTATPQSVVLEAGVMNSHLVLDRTASEAIHLLPQHGNNNSPNSSLFGILNRCRTSMGSRELKAWLRQPLVVLEDIQKRQNAVTLLMQCVDRLRDEALAGWPDVDVIATKLESYKENVQGPTCRALACLYKLYLLAIQQVPVLREALEECIGESQDSILMQEVLQGIQLVETELSLSSQLVETMLDLEEAPRNYLVKASFQAEMQQIKEELDGLEEEFGECLQDMNDEWMQVSGKKDQVRLEALDNGDYQFRLPSTNDSKLLQARFEGVTVHRLLKNGVYFSTKTLRQLATKKQDLMEEYDKFQREIVVNAMKVAATYVPVLERTSALVSQLDVLCSLAHVAAYSPTGYCKPTLTDGDEDGLGIEVSSVSKRMIALKFFDMPKLYHSIVLQLKGARHPCVELQDSIEYIPNDISLIFGESSFLMVTGPNMGGKSTYIRSLGAIVTLAQIGAYVPCTSAKINIVHHILARVGAGDVQNSGISTFMAEMLEASSILRTATKRSLIIIDELGRGTSTFDGFGLATAISQWIIQQIGCMTVFATHFHELTALEDRFSEAKNCHVTASTAGWKRINVHVRSEARTVLGKFRYSSG